jgi:hypothetical protein
MSPLGTRYSYTARTKADGSIDVCIRQDTGGLSSRRWETLSYTLPPGSSLPRWRWQWQIADAWNREQARRKDAERQQRQQEATQKRRYAEAEAAMRELDKLPEPTLTELVLMDYVQGLAPDAARARYRGVVPPGSRREVTGPISDCRTEEGRLLFVIHQKPAFWALLRDLGEDPEDEFVLDVGPAAGG